MHSKDTVQEKYTDPGNNVDESQKHAVWKKADVINTIEVVLVTWYSRKGKKSIFTEITSVVYDSGGASEDINCTRMWAIFLLGWFYACISLSKHEMHQ